MTVRITQPISRPFGPAGANIDFQVNERRTLTAEQEMELVALNVAEYIDPSSEGVQRALLIYDRDGRVRGFVDRNGAVIQIATYVTDPVTGALLGFRAPDGSVVTLAGGSVVDAVPTDGSPNAVSSNGVFDALAALAATIPPGAVSPDGNTSVSVSNGQIAFTVDGNPAGMIEWDAGMGWPKWTIGGGLDPMYYQGTARTLAQRDAMVMTSPAAKAGWLVWVVDVGVNEYQYWTGTAWVSCGGGSGVTSLSALTDVDLATTPPAAGNLLSYNGTDWVPVAPTPGAVIDAVPTDGSTNAVSSNGVFDALALRAPLVHTHVIADTTGLQAALDGKAALVHTHVAADVTDFAPAVRATTLTGLSTATATDVVATDTVLGAIGKLQGQLDAIPPAAVRPVVRLSAAVTDLAPGTYDIDSSGGAFAITLADVVGVWDFSNANRSLSTNAVTIGSAAQTYTDSAGAQVPGPFLLNVPAKPVSFIKTAVGDGYFVAIDVLPASSSPMVGATPTAAGAAGLVPAPDAGRNHYALSGAGTFVNVAQPFDSANAYAAGDRVQVGRWTAVANAAIPAGTAFAWGTTGATWSPVLPATVVWRGLYSVSTVYAAGDVVATATGVNAGIYMSQVSANVGRATTSAWWQPAAVESMNAMFGADGTNAGVRGLVPAPAPADNVRFLRGDGTWADAGGGTAEPLERSHVARNGTNYVTVANGAFIFDIVVAGAIPYSTTTGRWTLTAGKTYRLKASILVSQSGSVLGYAWRNVTTATQIGTSAIALSADAASPLSTQHEAVAFITPSATTEVELRTFGAVTTSQSSATSHAIVEEIPTATTVNPGAVPVGTLAVGQTADAAITDSQSTTSTTFVDVAGASVTLPGPGTYELQYSIQASHTTLGAGVILAISDAANNILPGSYSFGGQPSGVGSTGPLSGRVRVTVAAAETYKVRWRHNSGTGTAFIFNSIGAGSSWFRFEQQPTATVVNAGSIAPTPLAAFQSARNGADASTAAYTISTGSVSTSSTTVKQNGNRLQFGTGTAQRAEHLIVGPSQVQITKAGRYRPSAMVSLEYQSAPGAADWSLECVLTRASVTSILQWSNTATTTGTSNEQIVLAGGTFDLQVGDAIDWRVGFGQVAVANIFAHNLELVEVPASTIIDPGAVPVVGWTNYVPAITAATNPTKGTTTVDSASFFVVGKMMTLSYTFTQTVAGTAGVGVYRIAMPAGYTIDTSRVQVNTTGAANVGTVLGHGSGASGSTVQVLAFDASSLMVRITIGSTNTATFWGQGAGGNQSLATAAVHNTFTAQIPIV